MAEEWDYGNDWGATYDPWYPEMTNGGGVTDYFQNPAYQTFIGGGDPTGPGTGDYSGGDGGGGTGWLNTVLGGLGQVGSFLGNNASALGPLLSGAGSIASGAIGSNAANEAARLQSQAINRGIDLQTSQWLQQQANLAPYLQAGQGGLSQLQQLAGREQPGLPGQMASIDPRSYGMPDATPRWTPQGYQGPANVNAGDYRWNPQQGPQAQDYRYTPGQTPDAANYRYTAGAVPTLSGQELLANDPGVAFRLGEGRKALEASAAAKGGLLSGPTLAALQRQGQELGSQEYGAAWNRASQQAQLREQWGQAESQMGWGQAEAASRLREQVNQIASQQGWSQAQAEAAFREGQAQLASQQGFNQALSGQQNQYTQGLESQKWLQAQQQLASDQLYNRNMDQYKMVLGQDVARNQTDYERQQAAYRQQLAQFMLPYEQQSTLANLGGQAVGMYGQQGQGATNAISNLLGQYGTAQGQGALSGANSWMNALTNVGGAAQGYFGNQAYEQGRQSVLSGINR